MKRVVGVLALSMIVAVTGFAGAEEEMKLQVGDKAPDFTIPDGAASDQIGDAKKLSDLQGKNVVLAFYPKAFTPGCTSQMCGYRDEFSMFKSNDTVVLAISVDQQAESNRFKQEHNLPFAVLGDPNKEIIKKYGVEILSRNNFEYAKRTTFLIDGEGTIRYIDWDYHYNNGKEPLFAAIQKLEGGGDSAKKEEGSESK